MATGKGAEPAATKDKESGRAERTEGDGYQVWRSYSPCELRTSDDGPLPLECLQKILELTGFSDLNSLKKELFRYQRHSIPVNIQKRLASIFQVGINPGAVDGEIYLTENSKTPYPFSADANAKAIPLSISDFVIDVSKNKSALKLTVRVGTAVHRFLKPRSPGDVDFCRLVVHDNNGDLSESTDNSHASKNEETIADWLAAKGVKRSVAKKLSADSDWRSKLRDQVYDRIESLVWVSGAPDVYDEFLMLQGEEEKGFIDE